MQVTHENALMIILHTLGPTDEMSNESPPKEEVKILQNLQLVPLRQEMENQAVLSAMIKIWQIKILF